MNNYWEERYKSGSNSGIGSYGEFAIHKADVINNYITKFNIETISDFGCGDGNQITLLKGFKNYVGYDISASAIFLCREKFRNITNVDFCLSIHDLPEADMCLPLDVLYHIIDETDFIEYLNILFLKSKKYVLIYSSNHDSNENEPNYIFHRKITDWVDKNYKDFVFVEETNNFLATSAMFYLYERKII